MGGAGLTKTGALQSAALVHVQCYHCVYSKIFNYYYQKENIGFHPNIENQFYWKTGHRVVWTCNCEICMCTEQKHWLFCCVDKERKVNMYPNLSAPVSNICKNQEKNL